MLFLGPVAVAVVSAYIYLTGGQFVATDNAYIQADKVVITVEVSGPIVALMVAENDHVTQGLLY